MKKEDVLTIIEALRNNCDTGNLYDMPELSDTNIKEVLQLLERQRVLKFTMKPVHFEDGKFITRIEFSPDADERIEALF